jgi:hypothetical protein
MITDCPSKREHQLENTIPRNLDVFVGEHS